MIEKPFEFGVQAAATFSGGRQAIITEARRAEDSGFTDFYTFDHLGFADPFLPLLVAAEATSVLRLGCLVLNAAFYNPALLARSAATLDQLTGGRSTFGIGAGWAKDELDAIGVEFEPAPARVDRLEEVLSVVGPLLRGGSVRVDGRHVHADVESLGIDIPGGRVPILVGGYGDRMLGLAAEFADVVQFTGLSHASDGAPRQSGYSRAKLAERVATFSELAGPRLDDITRSLIVTELHVGSSLDSIAADLTARTGLDRAQLLESPFVLAGEAPAIVEKLLRTREELGISHVVVLDAEAFAPVVARLNGP